jgi:hypothetical protein
MHLDDIVNKNIMHTYTTHAGCVMLPLRRGWFAGSGLMLRKEGVQGTRPDAIGAPNTDGFEPMLFDEPLHRAAANL